MSRVIIFGMGIVANTYLKAFPDIEEEVIGYLESKKGTVGEYNNRNVYQIESLTGIDFDEVHVANSHYETVEQLQALGIDNKKIVLCYIGLLKECLKRNGDLIFRYNLPAVLTSKFFHSNIFGDECFTIGNNRCILNEDYCRRGTLQLIIDEVKTRNIEGDLAELGVYRGDFSKYLNSAFPDRKLYLFDTFEGFSLEQESENIKCGYSTSFDIENSNFADTSVKLVMDKMEHPEQVVVCKGLFPESIPKNIEEGVQRYAIVSLDCDLYTPIFDGLLFFYPRLSEGGYIMIHDYNNDKFSAGIRKAIDDYEHKYCIHLSKVPLPDEEGTLVITK